MYFFQIYSQYFPYGVSKENDNKESPTRLSRAMRGEGFSIDLKKLLINSLSIV